MSSPRGDRGRYTSRSSAYVRTGAQYLLLKPAVWRLVDVRVHGAEHLDDLEGAFIAVANHSSHLDAPLVIGSLPRRLAQYLATGAAADYFFDRWWKAAPTALFFNAFPVDRKGTRGRKGMAGNLLGDGVPLLLFPEGTRSRTGEMGSFKPGAAALCLSRDVPCLPVAIVGASQAMPHGRMPQPGEIAHQFNERMRRQVLELHDSTARAYGLKTLAEYAHTAALEKARSQQDDAGQGTPAD